MFFDVGVGEVSCFWIWMCVGIDDDDDAAVDVMV